MKQEGEVISVCLHMYYCAYIQNATIINQALLPVPPDSDKIAAGTKKTKELNRQNSVFSTQSLLFACEEV